MHLDEAGRRKGKSATADLGTAESGGNKSGGPLANLARGLLSKISFAHSSVLSSPWGWLGWWQPACREQDAAGRRNRRGCGCRKRKAGDDEAINRGGASKIAHIIKIKVSYSY